MGLAALFKQAAALGFAIAADVKTPAVLKVNPTDSYNADTGVTTQVWAATKTVQAVAYVDKNQKADAVAAEMTMKKFMVLMAELSPLAPAEIRQTSRLEAEGHTWQVLSAEPDPAGATVILTCQR